MPLAKLEAFPSQLVELSAFARALSHPARISILQYLAPLKEAASLDIVAHLPLSQPACSRHLSELVKVGLLHSRPSGSNVFYRLEQNALNQFCRSMSAALHS